MNNKLEYHTKIMDYFTNNPNMTGRQIGKHFGLKKTQISNIISKFVPIEKTLSVVPSLEREKIYFAFDGITEREFRVRNDLSIIDIGIFNDKEKNQLINLGFKIRYD